MGYAVFWYFDVRYVLWCSASLVWDRWKNGFYIFHLASFGCAMMDGWIDWVMVSGIIVEYGRVRWSEIGKLFEVYSLRKGEGVLSWGERLDVCLWLSEWV